MGLQGETGSSPPGQGLHFLLSWGWNTVTYIHPCILGPALREGDSDGDRFPPPQVLGSSSQHPLCPF